ncbi:uncharacterized protein BDCG_17877 [Blastomyces dermatitidis ER-3]|uniref:Uncharacterized protein n=1 Tax=Ajellomyces dermatitidis (strain ER-3 / ATCC MYA-2586) TaxID=559297 RepID=A0ABX2W0T8_AJEDR|nr:uncharacterized protein BDCG_17877 [Blastomyces dermatitidis ER-3]OAT03000.1 hypothetical protein BDCG_17877 [Blastomyces dermatitidis ER-3]
MPYFTLSYNKNCKSVSQFPREIRSIKIETDFLILTRSRSRPCSCFSFLVNLCSALGSSGPGSVVQAVFQDLFNLQSAKEYEISPTASSGCGFSEISLQPRTSMV